MGGEAAAAKKFTLPVFHCLFHYWPSHKESRLTRLCGELITHCMRQRGISCTCFRPFLKADRDKIIVGSGSTQLQSVSSKYRLSILT